MTSQIVLPQRRAFADPSAKLYTELPDDLIFATRLGRSGASDTDAESLARCGFNMAPNGPRGPLNRLLIGAPTVADDYWTFTADTNLANVKALRYPIEN